MSSLGFFGGMFWGTAGPVTAEVVGMQVRSIILQV